MCNGGKEVEGKLRVPPATRARASERGLGGRASFFLQTATVAVAARISKGGATRGVARPLACKMVELLKGWTLPGDGSLLDGLKAKLFAPKPVRT
jgi:hypothetical protein